MGHHPTPDFNLGVGCLASNEHQTLKGGLQGGSRKGLCQGEGSWSDEANHTQPEE